MGREGETDVGGVQDLMWLLGERRLVLRHLALSDQIRNQVVSVRKGDGRAVCKYQMNIISCFNYCGLTVSDLLSRKGGVL